MDISTRNQIINELAVKSRIKSTIDPLLYEKYNVKRGLRNADGTGVLVGLTEIGEVYSYIMDDNDRVPVEGHLYYRGIDVTEMVNSFFEEKRYGFEECTYLLLFGDLPTSEELSQFKDLLGSLLELPEDFTEDVILKAKSPDIMNMLARAVLANYSYDHNPDDISIENVLRQSIELIAHIPAMIAYSYMSKIHYTDRKSLFLHAPRKDYSTAQNILYMIHPDGKFTELEARILDLCLVLHAEHGGGNNSTFVTRAASSTGTDTYSVIAAAISSLKGPQHGGASNNAFQMMQDLKMNVRSWDDEGEISGYLSGILQKKAFDKRGLIYGIGHAVYTLSDPRAILLSKYAEGLAENSGRQEEYKLYKTTERLAVEMLSNANNKVICANIDFYSGFVYSMLGIPPELFTPIFAAARIAGWCAHHIEERVSGGRIIRPAFKSVQKRRSYTLLNQRNKG